MMHSTAKRNAIVAIAVTIVLTLVLTPAPLTDAADHRDGPRITDINNTLDIADLYLFLDPGDNSRVVIALTTTGFIVPGENSSAGIFDSTSRYLIEIENTGDAKPDQTFQVFFQARLAVNGVPQPQLATITLPNGRSFTAPATNPDSTSPNPLPPVVTNDSATGIKAFAGLV